MQTPVNKNASKEAKELLNYIELEKEEDPSRYQTVYTAKIRLPKIDYRF